MPLKTGKSKEAFSHNVKVEMEAGKPQKQALAIAYSEMRRHGHSMANGGTCEKCGDACKYASGGEVKGVHQMDTSRHSQHIPGESKAGKELRSSNYNKEIGRPTSSRIDKEDAKEEHYRILSEMQEMPKPKLQGLAEGGEVDHEPDLTDHVGQEFMDSIHKKDHKGMLESIRALMSTIKHEEQE